MAVSDVFMIGTVLAFYWIHYRSRLFYGAAHAFECCKITNSTHDVLSLVNNNWRHVGVGVEII